MSSENPAEWVNLTHVTENEPRTVDWRKFGAQNWEARLTNRYFTGALEVGITRHIPSNQWGEPTSEPSYEPWEPEYWDLSSTTDFEIWELLNEAWAGRHGWTLWIKGPLPARLEENSN